MAIALHSNESMTKCYLELNDYHSITFLPAGQYRSPDGNRILKESSWKASALGEVPHEPSTATLSTKRERGDGEFYFHPGGPLLKCE